MGISKSWSLKLFLKQFTEFHFKRIQTVKNILNKLMTPDTNRS